MRTPASCGPGDAAGSQSTTCLLPPFSLQEGAPLSAVSTPVCLAQGPRCQKASCSPRKSRFQKRKSSSSPTIRVFIAVRPCSSAVQFFLLCPVPPGASGLPPSPGPACSVTLSLPPAAVGEKAGGPSNQEPDRPPHLAGSAGPDLAPWRGAFTAMTGEMPFRSVVPLLSAQVC